MKLWKKWGHNISDDKLLELLRIAAKENKDDREVLHAEFDDLLLQTLKISGYKKSVAYWQKIANQGWW